MQPAYRTMQIPTFTGEHQWIWIILSEDGKIVATSRCMFLSKEDCEEHIMFMTKNMQLKEDDKPSVWLEPDLQSKLKTLKTRLKGNSDDDTDVVFREICVIIEGYLRCLYKSITDESGKKKNILTLHKALMANSHCYHEDREKHQSIHKSIKKVADHRNSAMHGSKVDLSHNDLREIITNFESLPMAVPIGLLQEEFPRLA